VSQKQQDNGYVMARILRNLSVKRVFENQFTFASVMIKRQVSCFFLTRSVDPLFDVFQSKLEEM